MAPMKTAAAEKLVADPLAFAKRVRSVLADKTGDPDWLRVPAPRIPMWDGPDDAAALADWITDDQGYEPHHFLDEGKPYCQACDADLGPIMRLWSVTATQPPPTLAAILTIAERCAYRSALARAAGSITNAALELGVGRVTASRAVDRLGLRAWLDEAYPHRDPATPGRRGESRRSRPPTDPEHDSDGHPVTRPLHCRGARGRPQELSSSCDPL